MPQLKTRSISSGATSPMRASQAKTGGGVQAVGVQHGQRALGQHARQVARQAAAGDVRGRLHQPGAMQREDRLHIDPRRLQQRLAERAAGGEGGGAGHVGIAALDDAAHQREAVGMHAGRPQPEHHVAGAHIAGAAAARRVRPRPPRSRRGRSRRRRTCPASRPSRRRPGRSRPGGSPRRCRRRPASRRPRPAAGGEIIEEEQRLGALHHQVVDAHGDQVDADRRMQPGLDRDAQLGADAIGAW